MNDSPHTPWPAFIQDEQAEFPEHFDWGALAASRARSVPAPTAGAADASSERNGAFGDGQASSQTIPPIAAPESQPKIEETSPPDDPGNLAAGVLAPVPETRATQHDAGALSGPPAPARSMVVVDHEPLPLTKMRHPPLSLTKDGILRLRFSDVGEPSEPGEHRSRYGLIEITRNDLAVWKAFPDAIFTVIQPSPYSNATISRLGTFEV